MPHPPASADYKKSTFPLGCNLCKSDGNNGKKIGAGVTEVSLDQEEEVKAVLPQRGGVRTTDEQREELQREREDRVESQREALLRFRLEKTALLKKRSLEEKQARERALQKQIDAAMADNVNSSGSNKSSPRQNQDA